MLSQNNEKVQELQAAIRTTLSKKFLYPNDLKPFIELAGIHSEQGDYKSAERLWTFVVECLKSMLPPDSNLILHLQLNQAHARKLAGDHAGALDLEKHIERAWSRTLPADSQDLQDLHLNMALSLKAVGDLSAALEIEEQLETLQEKMLGTNSHDLWKTKTNLSATKFLMGDYDSAFQLIQEVEAAYERLLPSNDLLLQQTRMNKALVMKTLGDHAGAARIEEVIEQELTHALPPTHPTLLLVRENLAGSKIMSGEFVEAQIILHSILPILERVAYVDGHDVLHVKAMLSLVMMKLGDLANAFRMQRAVEDILSTKVPGWHHELYALRILMAQACYWLGNYSECRTRLKSLVSIKCHRNISQIPELDVEAEANRNHRELNMTLSLLLSCDSSTNDKQELRRDECEAIILYRNIVERHVLIGRAIASMVQDNAALRDKAEDVTKLNSEYVTSIREGGGVHAARRRLLDAQRRLYADVSGREGISEALGVPTMEHLCSWIGAHGVAIIIQPFLRYGHQWSDPDSVQLTAFVIKGDGDIHRYDLGEETYIESRVQHFVESLAVRRESEYRDQVVVPGSPERRGQEAIAAVLGEVVSSFDSTIRTVWIAPTRSLAAMPWEAIWLSKLDCYLGEHVNIRYFENLTSAALGAESTLKEPSLVLVGGIDYGATLTGGWEGFKPLPSTANEIMVIGHRFTKEYALSPVVLSGAQATVEDTRAAFQSARWIHCATHGWIAEDYGDTTSEVLDRGLMIHFSDNRVWSLDRGQLYGLALSGVNTGRSTAWNAGMLTGTDVSYLNMNGCELVTLSACATNVGIRLAGESVAGMSRAFHRAGVRSIIATLWPVLDRATFEFMLDLYNQMWGHAKPPAEALRLAKTFARERGEGPMIWAAFTLHE